MVDLGPFFPDGVGIGWEWDNPLAYFNLLGLVASILILRRLSARRGESGLADGAWRATWVFAVGTGLHFLGDITGVAESWDHQFIHFVVLVALATFLWSLRTDSPVASRPASAPAAAPPPPAPVASRPAAPPSSPPAAPASPATEANPAAKPAARKTATKKAPAKR